MRSADQGFIQALTAAPSKGIKPRRFFWARCVTRDSVPVVDPIGVWTGDRDITVLIKDSQTGTMVNRTYYGMGKKLSIPSIPRVSDLTIQTISCKLSQLSPITQKMTRENNLRFAKVEIHEGLLDPQTKFLTSPPELVFIGEIDGDPIETPKAGGTGSINLELVSDAIRTLTLKNPAKRSHETQSQRNGDQFGKYGNVIEMIKLSWGELEVGQSPPKQEKKSGIFG